MNKILQAPLCGRGAANRRYNPSMNRKPKSDTVTISSAMNTIQAVCSAGSIPLEPPLKSRIIIDQEQYLRNTGRLAQIVLVNGSEKITLGTEKSEYMNTAVNIAPRSFESRRIMKKLRLKSQAEKCYMVQSSECTIILRP